MSSSDLMRSLIRKDIEMMSPTDPKVIGIVLVKPVKPVFHSQHCEVELSTRIYTGSGGVCDAHIIVAHTSSCRVASLSSHPRRGTKFSWMIIALCHVC